MNIWELDKLYLFIAFIIPGFIGLKAYDLFVPGNEKDSSKQIIDAIALSCLNYAILLWPILMVESSELKIDSKNLYALFYMIVLFLAPVIWAFAWKNLRETQFLQKNAPHPTKKPWDYVFSKRKPYWVIVTLKDGTKVGGKYDSKSFASSTQADEQLYLEECWKLNEDGGFDRPRNTSEGIIILSSEMATIELFENK